MRDAPAGRLYAQRGHLPGRGGRRLSLQQIDFRQNVLDIDVGGAGVRLLEPDDALLVDDYHGAEGGPLLLIEYAVLFRDLAVRVKVAEHR